MNRQRGRDPKHQKQTTYYLSERHDLKTETWRGLLNHSWKDLLTLLILRLFGISAPRLPVVLLRAVPLLAQALCTVYFSHK